MTTAQLTYAASGVSYKALDPFKRMAQEEAQKTAQNIEQHGPFREIPWSRGESVYLIETPDMIIAHVEEGLGTKNLVADALEVHKDPFYAYLAQDTVAMIVNDMATVGAQPLSVAMHCAAGDSEWFDREVRQFDLINGWRGACDTAGAAWGCGETPVLKGIVMPGAAVLSGSAMGIVYPKDRLISPRIKHGDAIVLLGSSGIHANGLTLARKIAERKDPLWRRLLHLFAPQHFPLKTLADGYYTIVAHSQNGRGITYAEVLLQPTTIYVPVVQECLNRGLEIHYAVNITGHGWRKLMRAAEPFVYVVEEVPDPQPVFQFIQEHGPVSEREMYSNFNMGAGFALYVPPRVVEHVITVAHKTGVKAMKAGHIEKQGDNRRVVILPKGIEYGPEDLEIR